MRRVLNILKDKYFYLLVLLIISASAYAVYILSKFGNVDGTMDRFIFIGMGNLVFLAGKYVYINQREVLNDIQ